MNKAAISAYIQPSGHPAFTPERPKTADLGKDYPSGIGKPHDARRDHIKQGGAMSDQPTKETR
jgi:hypothetical protein